MASLALRSIIGAMLAGIAPALAASGPWLELSPRGDAGHALVELDVSSIHEGLLGPEAVIRVTRRGGKALDDPDAGYGSWRMHILFRCDSMQLEPLAVSVFSGARGQGRELEARTNLSGEGIPEHFPAALSPPVRASLLRAACSRASVRSR